MKCECVSTHVPKNNTVQRHHVLPKSWGGTDTTPSTVAEGSNILPVCPTAHENIHDLLNHYVRQGAIPSWDIQKYYSPFTRHWARVAWDHRIDGHKTPYTMG